jgi:predicted ribosome quality control (RQC) complex YloA/Tae2 family protein
MKEVFFNDIKYLIGESAQDNWDLLKLSKQDYIWFHLEKQSSPYVIICESETNLRKNGSIAIYLNEAAMLCKKYSKLKNTYKIRIIYTEIKNLKKGDKIGSIILKRKPSIIIL